MIDALFVLDCGCVLDGCSDSHPGQFWKEGGRNGQLLCTEKHNLRPAKLVGMVSLDTPMSNSTAS